MTSEERARRRRWGMRRSRLLDRRRGPTEELTRPRDRLGALAAGEQAAVPDAMEARWQDVEEKPADELVDVERHRRVAAAASILQSLTLNVTLRSR
jgi:hypothetical protein